MNDGSNDNDHRHDKSEPAWMHDGVRVVPADNLGSNTAQTPGMDRKAAINFARVGAQKLWAGTVTIHANAKTGAHHHGPLESVIYVVRGKARMRWGERLEFVAEAGPGDFIYIPPYVPHQEINASPDELLECVLVRSDGEAVVVNLDIEPVEKPLAPSRASSLSRGRRHRGFGLCAVQPRFDAKTIQQIDVADHVAIFSDLTFIAQI
jgi:uncharacterized RmlC-like cupin family protein